MKYILHYIDTVEIEKLFDSREELITFVLNWLEDEIEAVEN